MTRLAVLLEWPDIVCEMPQEDRDSAHQEAWQMTVDEMVNKAQQYIAQDAAANPGKVYAIGLRGTVLGDQIAAWLGNRVDPDCDLLFAALDPDHVRSIMGGDGNQARITDPEDWLAKPGIHVFGFNGLVPRIIRLVKLGSRWAMLN
jgi:hypothetical protein